MERDNWIRSDLSGVAVDYWIWRASSQTWQYLGRATSAGDGYADLRATVPSTSGNHYVAGRVASGQSYTSGFRYLYVVVRPASSVLVVTDIDWTIAAVDWDDFLFRSNSAVPPVRGAVQALADIGRSATIVYLTARDDYFANKTRAWLTQWGFPTGPAIFSDGTTMVSDPTDYKSDAIAAIAASFWDVRAGFGNKSTDHAAYMANGLDSYQFDTETRDFPSGTWLYHDWEDLRAAVRSGQRPELASWATSYR